MWCPTVGVKHAEARAHAQAEHLRRNVAYRFDQIHRASSGTVPAQTDPFQTEAPLFQMCNLLMDT